jgi:hypothetical protein
MTTAPIPTPMNVKSTRSPSAPRLAGCGRSAAIRTPALARFAGDLEWLAKKGVEVARHNLAQEPQAFIACDAARTALVEQGDEALPLILLDGEPISSGRYPYRSELAAWTGLPIPRRPVRLAMAPPSGGGGGCCGGGSC